MYKRQDHDERTARIVLFGARSLGVPVPSSARDEQHAWACVDDSLRSSAFPLTRQDVQRRVGVLVAMEHLAERYSPSPCDVPIVLVRARDGIPGADAAIVDLVRSDPFYGWKRHVAKLSVADTDGDHFTMVTVHAHALSTRIAEFLQEPASSST